MKHQLVLLISGALSVIAVSTAAIAQPNTVPTPSDSLLFNLYKAPSGTALAMSKGGPGSGMSAVGELDLSVSQQAKVEAIQVNLIDQISEILTAEQVQTFMDSQNSGDRSSMRSMMMNLDRDKRSSVMNIMRTAQSDVMDVLTPEQRAQIEDSRPIDRN